MQSSGFLTSPQSQKTDCNHIFLNFLPPVILDPHKVSTVSSPQYIYHMFSHHQVLISVLYILDGCLSIPCNRSYYSLRLCHFLSLEIEYSINFVINPFYCLLDCLVPQIAEKMVSLVSQYGIRLYKLRVTEAEIKTTIRYSPTQPHSQLCLIPVFPQADTHR